MFALAVGSVTIAKVHEKKMTSPSYFYIIYLIYCFLYGRLDYGYGI